MKSFFFAIALISFFFLLPKQALASVFYLSPESSSIQKDSSFQVQVKLNTQDEVVNGVSAYLAFPQDKLEFISIEGNGDILPIVAEETVNGNVIKISRANLSSVNGDLTIAKINFKAKNEGSALVQFIPGSAVPRTIDSRDSLNLRLSTGGSYQVNNGPESTSSSPRPSGRNISRCSEKEPANRSRFNTIVTDLTDIKASFDTILVLVDEYYSTLNAIPAYDSQRKEVEAKRFNALTQLEKLKKDIEAFNCHLTGPGERLNQIKMQSLTTKTGFSDYQVQLRKLIRVLRIGGS